MRLEWLLNPLTIYGIAAGVLLLSLVLVVSIKLEMAKARKMAKDSDAAREAERVGIRALETELESLRASVRQLAAVPPARPTGVGINLTKRTQALRMYRRGEAIPSIAAALETPCNEIALLLKVHALTNEVQEKAS